MCTMQQNDKLVEIFCCCLHLPIHYALINLKMLQFSLTLVHNITLHLL